MNNGSVAPTALMIAIVDRRAMIVAFFLLGLGRADATDYRINATETTSSFEVWMLGLFPIRGQFANTTGEMRLELARQSGHIAVVIDTTSLTANSLRAQTTARGPEFFNVTKYPRIEFKSSRFVYDGSRLLAIEGGLTMLGITQPVTLAVGLAACAPAVEREICHAEASLTVQRSAFGMRAWSRSISDNVTIRISLVALALVTNMRETTPQATTAPVPASAIPIGTVVP